MVALNPTRGRRRHSYDPRMNRTPLLRTLFVSLAMGTGGASARQDADAPLSGPTVSPAKIGPTIVERTMDGSVRRVEVRPEEAAVRKLTLDPEESARVEAVLAERARDLDQIVRENIDLLVRVQSAKAAGEPKALNQVMQEFREAMRPLAVKGSLAQRLHEALSPDHAASFDLMVRDYFRALVAEGNKSRPMGDPMDDSDGASDSPTATTPGTAPGTPGGAPPPPRKAERRAAVVRQYVEVFAQEVRRSYERISAEGHQRLEELVKRLELSPEQEAKVREMATELGQKTKLNPTPAQRAELFGKVLVLLTPEQRAKAVEFVTNGR